MESIEQMIKRLCPKGVEWKKISEIAYYPKVRINTETLSVDTYVGVESLIKDRGGKTSSSSLPEGVAIEFLPQDILIGNIRPYLKKIWLSDCQGGTNGDVICIRVLDSKEVIPKYLYHNLASDKFFDYDNSHAKGGKMPRGDKNAILAYKIPLPPLEIQSRIVEVLDKMATLTAELEAELEARKQQYEYYRNKLLIFSEIGGDKQVAWKKISEICTNICSGGTPPRDQSDYFIGNIPWLRTQEVNWTEIYDTELKISEEAVKNSSAKIIPSNCVIMAMYGATAAKACINKIELTTNQACCNLQIDSGKALYKYVYYWICNNYIKLKCLGEGSQNNLNAKKIKDFIIPIPPLSEQQRIVSILDRFEALTTDLQSGLPAEIEARRQQYEYYRNKLLTFEAV